MLQKLLLELIKMLQSIGYNVVLVNSDQSAVNRKCFKSLGITPEYPFFYVSNQKIFGTFDVPHLFKSVSKKTSFETAESRKLMVNEVNLLLEETSFAFAELGNNINKQLVWERGKIYKTYLALFLYVWIPNISQLLK